MKESEERTELIARASKAIMQDRGIASSPFGGSNRTKDFAVHPDTNLKRVLEIVRNDPVVRGAITTLIDRTLEPGFSFFGKDKRSRNQRAVDKMQELRFERLLRPLLQHLFTYSNAFTEIVKLGDEPTELHALDPRFMEPHSTRNGEITGYVWKDGTDTVRWEPEEIVHFKTTPLGNVVWGDVDISALWVSCALSYHIKKLFLWQYETNQFRPLLNIKNATDPQIKRFLSFLEESRADIKKLIPIEGEVESIFLGQEMDYTKIKDLLTYLDYEKLNLLQVPPIAVGLPDNSNRSNSDSQERSLSTRVRSIHAMLEDMVSHDLLPKLGFDKVTLKFNVTDAKMMAQTLEMAERMRNMGMKEDIIKEFLESEGWDFPGGTIFEEMPDIQTSPDMFPSRKGKTEGEGNKQIGTGEQSTTRPEQLVARTKKYFYDYYVEGGD